MSIKVPWAATGTAKRIDLTHLPITQVDKGSKVAGVFLMGFAAFWGGIPTAVLIHAVSAGKMQAGLWGLLVFSVIGTGLFIGGLYLVTSRTTTILSHEQVSVTRKSLFGTLQWTAPLASFLGIRYRSEYHSGGKNRPSYTLYIVELHHKEPRKAVCLYESRSESGVRAIWEDACRKLSLPAVEGAGANLVIRSVEDLDKSVKELAQAGKLQVEFDPSLPPPAGLSLKADGRFLEVSVTKRAGGMLFGALFAVLFSGLFIYIGFFVRNAPIVFGIFGSGFLLIFLIVLAWTIITTEQIRVAKDEIQLRRQTPWGPTNGRRIDAATVEVVRIGKKDGQGSEGVLIETDAGTTLIGAGLPAGCLVWLKNCILKIIAN